MRNGLITMCIALLGAALIAVVPSCGGGSRHSTQLPAPGGSDIDGPGLVLLKDSSGAPTGIRVYWWRDNNNDTAGYYLYRDTQPITTANPALRVNGGNLIPQPDPSITAVIFDDLFAAQYKTTYYYRAATVDTDGDESELSIEMSITISEFSISSFSPIQGKYNSLVYIYGNYFGSYDALTDGVYFSGVKNDKGPSALYSAFVQAPIVTWENTRIVVRVPIGATVGPIRLVCNNIPQETNGDFACISPYILSVDPDPATAGQVFDIYGANFGIPDGSNRLLIDDNAYGGVFRSWADDHVSCTLPSSLVSGLSKVELLIGTEITNPYYCDILGSNAPRIDKITPDYGVANQTQITMSGRNFGTVPTDVTVYFHGIGVDSTSFISFSETSISFIVPVAAKRAGGVYVHKISTGEDSNMWLYHALPGQANVFGDGPLAGRTFGEYSDAAYGPNDTLYVLFTDTTKGYTGGLNLAKYTGGNWTYNTIYYQSNYIIKWPRLHVDSTGLVHFAFQIGPGGGNPPEVHYAQWDGNTTIEETVYTGAAGTSHGEWLAMEVFEDSLGGTNAFLFWGDGNSRLYGSHKLAGANTWTTSLVYTASPTNLEEVGRACSIDCYEDSAGSPPNNLWLMASSEIYSPNNTPTHQILLTTWDLGGGWGSDITGVGSSSAINETCTLWSDYSSTGNVLWCDSGGVYWTSDIIMGGTTKTVVSGGGPYGAALGFIEDPVDGNRWVAGSAGGTDFFWAYYDIGLDTWTTDVQSNSGGRSVTQAGRGGAAISQSLNKGFCSAYDPDMRDIIAIQEDKTGASLVLSWQDIGDNYATPGYDLSNRSLTLDSSGLSYAVFGDIDPVTGERKLWLAHSFFPSGAFNNAPWPTILLDSAPSGTLGHATIAADENDDLHIAYLKGGSVMYTKGNRALGFSPPKAIETVGAITTAPQIVLGTNSSLDVNILTPNSSTPAALLLLRSNTGMSTHNTVTTMTCLNPITQYGLGLKGNGDPVCAAYLESPTNALVVWDGTTQQTRSFSATIGMNAGVSLTVDDGGHFCATLADPAGTKNNYLLKWSIPLGDYALNTFGNTVYPTNSMMMSQWRNQYGPYVFYSSKDAGAPVPYAYLIAHVPHSTGADEYYFADSAGNTAVPPVFISGDPYTAVNGLSIYYFNTSEYSYLGYGTAPSP